ncbi:MAG TPA: hypothetical protein VJ747_19425 [Stellaceae bacterium]|nr:hypothetical protein [Stellaceae bacterium]
MDQAKQKEREPKRPKDQRDRPVEEEGDKDLKEGGMEQRGQRHPEK